MTEEILPDQLSLYRLSNNLLKVDKNDAIEPSLITFNALGAVVLNPPPPVLGLERVRPQSTCK